MWQFNAYRKQVTRNQFEIMQLNYTFDWYASMSGKSEGQKDRYTNRQTSLNIRERITVETDSKNENETYNNKRQKLKRHTHRLIIKQTDRQTDRHKQFPFVYFCFKNQGQEDHKLMLI